MKGVPNHQHIISFHSTEKIPNDEKYEDKTEDQNPSRFNTYEAVKVVKLIKELISHNPSILFSKIAVITPYKAQALLIEEKVRDMISVGASKEIEIGTADSFQGKEKPIVFISFVRSVVKGKKTRTYSSNIGFVKDMRRLNVMLSRSSNILIIVGDGRTLSNANNEKAKLFFKNLIGYIEKNKDTCKYYL